MAGLEIVSLPSFPLSLLDKKRERESFSYTHISSEEMNIKEAAGEKCKIKFFKRQTAN